ncbi:hypothetical protein ABH941_007039 [Streptacidiphilus sp. EB103A]
MPPLRRMVLGSDHSLDELRAAVAQAVQTLPKGDGIPPKA